MDGIITLSLQVGSLRDRAGKVDLALLPAHGELDSRRLRHWLSGLLSKCSARSQERNHCSLVLAVPMNFLRLVNEESPAEEGLLSEV